MNKTFEYTNKDIPDLKKDIVFRTMFCLFFVVIMVYQFINMVLMSQKSNMNTLQLCVSVSVIASCLMLAYVSLMYVFKSFRIISAIKVRGKCISSVRLILDTKRKGFVKLYNGITAVLTLLTSLILVSAFTYSILQIAYTSTLSFYLPLLLLICVSGFNSIYHLRDEIHLQQNVQEFNR